MKYYLISNKEDDYGNCNYAVYFGKESDIKGRCYEYKEIPKTHYEILKEYHENLNDKWYLDFGYETLKEYLLDCFW